MSAGRPAGSVPETIRRSLSISLGNDVIAAIRGDPRPSEPMLGAAADSCLSRRPSPGVGVGLSTQRALREPFPLVLTENPEGDHGPPTSGATGHLGGTRTVTSAAGLAIRYRLARAVAIECQSPTNSSSIGQ